MTSSPPADEFADAPQAVDCWCCGRRCDPARAVRLGDQPEVALCLGCARWAAKQAAAIEDHGKTGPRVFAREVARHGRQAVIRRGWHRSRLVGGALRWLGDRLP